MIRPRVAKALSIFLFFALVYDQCLPRKDYSNLHHIKVGAGLVTPEQRAQFVRDAWIHAWRGYRRYGYPHDMTKPLSHHTADLDFRSGWGCTAIDGLPAAILLEVPQAIQLALDHIAAVDWRTSSYPGVAIFGTTIRYLGAMLSAYDLLTTTHKHMLPRNSKTNIPQLLLNQSVALAEALIPSFATPTGINTNFLNYTSGNIIPRVGFSDITAVSGLLLEWNRLSDLTGDPKYRDLATKSMDVLLHQKNQRLPSVFPGLLPKCFNVTTGEFIRGAVGGWSHAWGGYYEMLLKNHLYLTSSPSSSPSPSSSLSASLPSSPYLDPWLAAANTTLTHLASHPKSHASLTFLADFNTSTGTLTPTQDHSSLFSASTFLLGGALTHSASLTSFGLNLVDTYIALYASSPTGLGPEAWRWIPSTCASIQTLPPSDPRTPPSYSDIDECSVPKQHRNTAQKYGYYPVDTHYRLRPEVLESLYYAYRLTGNQIYRSASWNIVTSVVQHCRVAGGFAELFDVYNVRGRKRDWMESWVLSETFMYAWLIWQDGDKVGADVEDGGKGGSAREAEWHVRGNGRDKWVWSTQGHPLRVRGLG